MDQCTYDYLGNPSCTGSVSSPVGYGGDLNLPGGFDLGPSGLSKPGSGFIGSQGGPLCEGTDVPAGAVDIGCGGGAGITLGAIGWCRLVSCPTATSGEGWHFKNDQERDQHWKDHKDKFPGVGLPVPDVEEYVDWASELLDQAIAGVVFGYDHPGRRVRCEQRGENGLWAVGNPDDELIVTFYPIFDEDCEEYAKNN